jgi:hypothetical protein
MASEAERRTMSSYPINQGVCPPSRGEVRRCSHKHTVRAAADCIGGPEHRPTSPKGPSSCRSADRLAHLGILGASLSLMVALATTESRAEELSLTPGLYQVEVRLTLPNVDNAAPPSTVTRCVTAADLQSGRAFFLLSDNPLRQCELLDYHASADTVLYRIACPGPNRGSAVAFFESTRTTYRGECP